MSAPLPVEKEHVFALLWGHRLYITSYYYTVIVWEHLDAAKGSVVGGILSDCSMQV